MIVSDIHIDTKGDRAKQLKKREEEYKDRTERSKIQRGNKK
jgi:hypothetical protein